MDQSIFHSQQQLWGAVEIIPNRLYYAPLNFFPPENNADTNQDLGTSSSSSHASSSSNDTAKKANKKEIHYFSIDTTLIYWNFFLDFGPLNLGQLYRFCSLVNHKLVAPEYKDCVLCYYSGARGEQKANACFLICAWSMLYLGRSVDEAYYGFRDFDEEDDSEGSMGGRNVSLPPRCRLNQALGSDDLGGVGVTNAVTSTASNTGGSLKSNVHAISDTKEELSPFAKINPLPPFHDASPIVCTYDLTVYDCLSGLEKARQLGFFKYNNTPNNVPTHAREDSNWPLHDMQPNHPNTFNVEEYEYFEQVENGDLNWIVQNKILAFAGPQSQKLITPEGFCMLTPADYIPYFRKQNVKLVIRLNKKCYDERDFEKVGIRHVEHYYLDGSCPEMSILQSVISDMESIGDGEAMAIHCKAGLGRTGTCIGAYLMKHYRLTAREVIGWMRICRPGMVIGPQQHFLHDIEEIMWQEGQIFRSNLVKNGALAASVANAKELTTHMSILATPLSKGIHAGQHVKIVTPDTVGSKTSLSPADPSGDDFITVLNESNVPSSPSSMTSLPTIDILKVQEQDHASSTTGDDRVKEGDQANALLERKLRQNLNQLMP
ncbi:hypothetical protein ACHAW6_016125 [Cyclotella cf. meneghiniana]